MAKVNVKGAHKVQGVRVDLPNDGNWLQRQRYVLRSDNVVLVSYQCATQYTGQSVYWGAQNFKVLGTVKNPQSFDLVAFVTKKHPDAVKIVADFS